MVDALSPEGTGGVTQPPRHGGAWRTHWPRGSNENSAHSKSERDTALALWWSFPGQGPWS